MNSWLIAAIIIPITEILLCFTVVILSYLQNKQPHIKTVGEITLFCWMILIIMWILK